MISHFLIIMEKLLDIIIVVVFVVEMMMMMLYVVYIHTPLCLIVSDVCWPDAAYTCISTKIFLKHHFCSLVIIIATL